jgi:hypothetical protein
MVVLIHHQFVASPAIAQMAVDEPHNDAEHPADQSNSHFDVRFFGAITLDMLFSGARPVSPGDPFYLAPGTIRGFNQSTFDINARQTMLGAELSGPEVCGFQSGGLIEVMFFDGSVIQDQYGILPLQAYGELTNGDWRFAAGLQYDVFNPLAPTVLPFSALAGSGNVGNSFRGQVRLERFLHPADDIQLTMQTALSEPITTTIDPIFQVSEDNGWPNIEGRIAVGLGPPDAHNHDHHRPIEVGVSAVGGQIRTTPLLSGPVVANVWGVGSDFRWKLMDTFGFQGEFYTGETLGTYDGAILQDINADTLKGIRSTGGWLETFFYWTPSLHSHVGFGIDDPINRDVSDSVGALGRTRNSTIFANLLWDVSESFHVGVELTWRETDYKSAPNNEGMGFQTQFQWVF